MMLTAPVRESLHFSWLKAPTSAFTFKTLLRHYAKQALIPRSLNVKLGLRRNFHKGRAAIRHYDNQTLVGAFSVITNLRMDLFEALVATFIFQLPASSLSKHNINAFYGQQLPQSRYLYLYQVCLTSCNVIQQCSNNVAACLRLASNVKGQVTTIKSVHCQ